MHRKTGLMSAAKHPLLLLDSRLVATAQNAALELGTVIKSERNPLFREEERWEARYDNVYPNVMYDEEQGLYKCWYSVFIRDSPSNGTPLDRRPSAAYGVGEREEGLLYAVSKDGIVWEKPGLGLIEFEGSTENNIVISKATHGIHAGGVFKDLHDPDPARRYKFLHLNASARRMAVAFSADGIHWSQPILWRRHNAAGDCHNNALWSPELGKYIGITRGWSGDIRTVLRSESHDFVHWSRPQEIMRGQNAHDQIYSMPIFRYGGLYLGLPAVFHQGDAQAPDWDTVDTELAWSPDSHTWHRICPGKPLIPRGAGAYPDGDEDCGCIYAAAPLLQDDRLLIYYGGSNGLHHGWREGSLNLATLAKDRFAGFVPQVAHQPAMLKTVRLRVQGPALTVNAEIRRGGSIRASLIDMNGTSPSGFGMDDCIAVTTGGLCCKLGWGQKRLDELADKNLRILFEIRQARLYAFSGFGYAAG